MDFSSPMDKAEFRKMLGEILLRTVWSDGAWYFPTIEILPKGCTQKTQFQRFYDMKAKDISTGYARSNAAQKDGKHKNTHTHTSIYAN